MDRKVNKDVSKLVKGEVTEAFKVLAQGLPGEKQIKVQCLRCNKKVWFPHQNFYHRKNCGCLNPSKKDVFGTSASERHALQGMTERWLREQQRYIPENLREFWRFRNFEPRWHPDNPDRLRNFIEDVGHKPKGTVMALRDPFGDFTADNFFWKPRGRSDLGDDPEAVSD